MCGICGIVNREGADAPGLARMAASLVHRGPDDHGQVLVGPAALAHRRLSIIDLGGGQQPIANEDGQIQIVFNGEIYNYRELRTELLARGHRFRTESDTEVIVHLYEEHGTGCLRRLRGMFAFAIWDARAQRLFAARDHLGQKPFYYAEQPGRLAFASEIKALLALDPGLARLDACALDEYLALRLVSAPRSMFQGIRKLPPAHFLTYDVRTGLRIERYWDLEYEPKHTDSEEQILEELEARLLEALRLHLIADVPVGAFLSGGLDSTLIVAMLARKILDRPLRTFSGSLPYGAFDEAPTARRVAELFGTQHTEARISPSLVRLLPRLVAQLDEPSDPLSVCSYLIAQVASQHVKVVLGGDGGDELFAGYDRYYGNLYAGLYARIPERLRSGLLGSMLTILPARGWYKSAGHQLHWLHRLSFLEGGERYAHSLNYFYLEDRERTPSIRSIGCCTRTTGSACPTTRS
jgi:asparagine synthase (glutamine-hydrolysing)